MANSKGKMTSVAEMMIEKGLAKDLAEARALVMAGKVVAGDQRVDKPGQRIAVEADLRLKPSARYVGRGGEKLHAALEDFELVNSLTGVVALDIGSSTGGFTDCLLNHGVKNVVALDVGTNQLVWKLRNDPRVISVEKTDIKNFDSEKYPKVDFVVGDISFNSLARLAPVINTVVNNPLAKYLLLVKPQFELDRSEVPDGGVIVDKDLQEKAVRKVEEAFVNLGFCSSGVFKSKILGRSGNQEYFVLFSPSG